MIRSGEKCLLGTRLTIIDVVSIVIQHEEMDYQLGEQQIDACLIQFLRDSPIKFQREIKQSNSLTNSSNTPVKVRSLPVENNIHQRMSFLLIVTILNN